MKPSVKKDAVAALVIAALEKHGPQFVGQLSAHTKKSSTTLLKVLHRLCNPPQGEKQTVSCVRAIVPTELKASKRGHNMQWKFFIPGTLERPQSLLEAKPFKALKTPFPGQRAIVLRPGSMPERITPITLNSRGLDTQYGAAK